MAAVLMAAASTPAVSMDCGATWSEAAAATGLETMYASANADSVQPASSFVRNPSRSRAGATKEKLDRSRAAFAGRERSGSRRHAEGKPRRPAAHRVPYMLRKAPQKCGASPARA